MAQRRSCISVSPYQTNCSLLSRLRERSPEIVSFSVSNLCKFVYDFRPRSRRRPLSAISDRDLISQVPCGPVPQAILPEGADHRGWPTV